MARRSGIEKWFEIRFRKKPKSAPSYFEEWVSRISGMNPESRMDSKSRKLYRKGLLEGWFD